jgi:hypothetical protein
MRIAIIENEEVINVIIANEVPDNGIECEDKVCVGWIYKDDSFIAPPIVYAVEEVTS